MYVHMKNCNMLKWYQTSVGKAWIFNESLKKKVLPFKEN